MTKKRLLENSPDSRPLEGLCGDGFVPRLPQTDVDNTAVEGVDRNTQVNHRVPPAEGSDFIPFCVGRVFCLSSSSLSSSSPNVKKMVGIDALYRGNMAVPSVTLRTPHSPPLIPLLVHILSVTKSRTHHC